MKGLAALFCLITLWSGHIQAAPADLAVAGNMSLVLSRDGVLWGIGRGFWPGGLEEFDHPTQMMTDIIATTGSGYHTLTLKLDHSLWGWGSSSEGELGQSPPESDRFRHYRPTRMMENVTAIAAVSHNSFALQGDGTLWGWGANFRGLLADGTHTARAKASRILSGVKRFAIEETHGLALMNDGRLMAWGLNVCGQLGNGTTKDSRRPVRVKTDMMGNQPIVALAVNWGRSMAVTADGTLWQWGLTDDAWTFDDNSTCPADVRTLLPEKVAAISNVADVALSGRVTLVLKKDGTLWSWGRNIYGLLGGGGYERTTPLQILDQVEAIATDAGSGYHALARKKDGSLWGWGSNTYSQLGPKLPGRTYEYRETPIPLPLPPKAIRLKEPE